MIGQQQQTGDVPGIGLQRRREFGEHGGLVSARIGPSQAAMKVGIVGRLFQSGLIGLGRQLEVMLFQRQLSLGQVNVAQGRFELFGRGQDLVHDILGIGAEQQGNPSKRHQIGRIAEQGSAARHVLPDLVGQFRGDLRLTIVQGRLAADPAQPNARGDNLQGTRRDGVGVSIAPFRQKSPHQQDLQVFVVRRQPHRLLGPPDRLRIMAREKLPLHLIGRRRLQPAGQDRSEGDKKQPFDGGHKESRGRRDDSLSSQATPLSVACLSR